MIVKQVTIFLKNGKREVIACFEYGVIKVKEKDAYAFKTGPEQVYTVPVELINLDLKFIVKHMWSFPPRQGPFQKPYDNR